MINNKNITIIHYILIIISVWILYRRNMMVVEHSLGTRIKKAMGFGLTAVEKAEKQHAKALKKVKRPNQNCLL